MNYEVSQIQAVQGGKKFSCRGNTAVRTEVNYFVCFWNIFISAFDNLSDKVTAPPDLLLNSIFLFFSNYILHVMTFSKTKAFVGFVTNGVNCMWIICTSINHF